MKTIMKLENLKSIKEMSSFINGTQSITFEVLSSKEEVYKMIEQILQRFCYKKLKKQDKGIVIQFFPRGLPRFLKRKV